MSPKIVNFVLDTEISHINPCFVKYMSCDTWICQRVSNISKILKVLPMFLFESSYIKPNNASNLDSH
jgi:hypothetical protein